MSTIHTTALCAPKIRSFTVTIPNSAAVPTEGTDLEGYMPIGIVMPEAWTTANLTFQATSDGVNYYDVYDSGGTEVTVTAAASRYIVLTPELVAAFAGVQKVLVRSGTTGSPVNQAAARTLLVLGRRVE